MTPNTLALMIRYFSGFVDLAIGAGLIALGIYLDENYERALQWRMNLAVVSIFCAALIGGLFAVSYGANRLNAPAVWGGLALIALALALAYWENVLPWTGYVVGIVGAGFALWGSGLVIWNTVVIVVFGVTRAASAGWHAGRER